MFGELPIVQPGWRGEGRWVGRDRTRRRGSWDCPRGKGTVKQQAECTQEPQERGVSLEQPVNPDKPSLDISPSRDTGCLLWGGSGGGSRRRCPGPWRVTFDCRFAAESHSQINLQVFSPIPTPVPQPDAQALQALNEEYFRDWNRQTRVGMGLWKGGVFYSSGPGCTHQDPGLALGPENRPSQAG